MLFGIITLAERVVFSNEMSQIESINWKQQKKSLPKDTCCYIQWLSILQTKEIREGRDMIKEQTTNLVQTTMKNKFTYHT